MNQSGIKKTTFTAMFTVLIIIGAYIAIPLPGTPVPIVLQNMFIALAGLIMGPVMGLISVAAYLFLGALGMPVFAGGKGGFVHFAGPTGGFLVSYLPAVFIYGFVSHLRKRSIFFDLLALILGIVCVFTIGSLWLKIKLGMEWSKVMTIAVLPFLPGEVIKVAASSIISLWLRPVYDNIMRKG